MREPTDVTGLVARPTILVSAGMPIRVTRTAVLMNMFIFDL